MRKARKPIFENETTIKISAPNLTRVSKASVFLKEVFKDAVRNDSGIRQNVESGVYFVYLNFDSEKIDVILEKVAVLAGGVRF